MPEVSLRDRIVLRIKDMVSTDEARLRGAKEFGMPSAVLELLEGAGREAVQFLQIGGNDGQIADPVRERALRGGWGGTIVEPVPRYFEMLRKNYAASTSIRFLNVAVGDAEGERAIYTVSDDFLRQDGNEKNRWMQGIASFDEAHVIRHGVSPAHIQQEMIRCVPAANFLKTHVDRPLDFIILDVEGFEWTILSQIDLDPSSADFIIFESDHITFEQAPRLRQRLDQFGYDIFWSNPDSIAISRRAF